jgi:nucleoside-triphosphatase
MRSNLMLTGPPGVGKTTLVLRVLEGLPPEAASGFVTRELRRDGRRVGFAVETLAGESAVLAHVDTRSPHRVGRYKVDLATFESTALQAIDPACVTAPLIVVDEIGKMECLSDRFRELVVAALGSNRAVLATIALRGNRFIESLKNYPEVSLLRITQQNRDRLVGQVVGWARETLAGV